MLNNDNITLTAETLAALGRKKATGEVLQTVFNLKREAKIFEAKAEEAKKESNALLSSISEDTGLTEFASNLGKIKQVNKPHKTLSADVLMGILAQKGFNAVEISEIISRSTVEKTVSSWVFYAAKGV